MYAQIEIPLNLKYLKLNTIDHNEKDLTKTTAKRCQEKKHKDIKLRQNEENNLLCYACPSTDINLLFETISDRIAFW